MLVKHLSERPIPVDERWPDLPPDLSRAVMMCLEKDPDDRFPNAAAFAQELSGGAMPNPAHRAQPCPPLAGSQTSSRQRYIPDEPRDQVTGGIRDRYGA